MTINFKEDISPCTMVIFGASGDLTERKLIPALYSLYCEEMIPDKLRVLGVARSELSEGEFRDKLCRGVEKYGRFKPALWNSFAERLHYLPGSYDDPDTYRHLGELLNAFDRHKGTQGNRLFYLAIPPQLYPAVIHHLGQSRLNRNEPGWARLIIEKPFGRDLETASQLNNKVHACFDESQVYRIDHYLGKETVQNILAFRFANFIFEEMWGRNFVDHVQITAVEDTGIGRRGGYYDQAGVVRDMLQNHLLQLLALTAMEPPAAFSAKALRDEKIKVLQAVRPLSLKASVWGQYQGYRQELEVAENSCTPTYIALKMYIDNWRWQGVPFYVRSGKNLSDKSTEIILKFKSVPHQIFLDQKELPTNHLALCIQPDEGMHLSFELKVPGTEMRTSPVRMDFQYKDLFGDQSLPDAYERLLLDALQGDASLFARSDEIERAWELVTPLLDEWEGMSDPPLQFYEPGSWGPDWAEKMISRDGRGWLLCCHDHHVDIPGGRLG